MDSSRESSVVAGRHEQTDPPDLQDPELAELQRSAQAPRLAVLIWFDPSMTWEAAPTGKRGRQPSYSDAAIQTSLTMKVLFGMALRQTTGFVESLLRLIGLDWAVPDFSTLSRRQKTLKVHIPYRGSDGPLHLLVDSTGIKVEGEGEWNARKHGGTKRRVCPVRGLEMVPPARSRSASSPSSKASTMPAHSRARKPLLMELR